MLEVKPAIWCEVMGELVKNNVEKNKKKKNNYHKANTKFLDEVNFARMS